MKTTFRTKIFSSSLFIAALAAGFGAFVITEIAKSTVREILLASAERTALLTAKQALAAVLADNRQELADMAAAAAAKGFEYVFIRSGTGKLLTSSLGKSFPAGLEEANMFEGETGRVGVRHRGENIWDIGARMPGGVGFVHVGLSQREIQRVISPVVTAVWVAAGSAVIVALIVSYIVSGMIAAPLKKLSAYADAISRGEGTEDPGISSEDEFGALARSLDRMKASIEIMLKESQEK